MERSSNLTDRFVEIIEEEANQNGFDPSVPCMAMACVLVSIKRGGQSLTRKSLIHLIDWALDTKVSLMARGCASGKPRAH